MKKIYFVSFLWLGLELFSPEFVRAQDIQNEAYAQGEIQPGYELLTEFTDAQSVGKLLQRKTNPDLEIRASKLFIDLNSQKEVEFTVSSQWANEFVWKFGDGSSLGGFRHVSHRYTKPGTYLVEVIASNKHEIARKSIEINVIDQSAPLELEEMMHYVVFPHDNRLEAEIQLNLPRREKNLQLEVQDVEGNQVFQYDIGKVRRKERIHVDLQNLEGGKYYTVLKGKKYSLVSKLTVAR